MGLHRCAGSPGDSLLLEVISVTLKRIMGEQYRLADLNLYIQCLVSHKLSNAVCIVNSVDSQIIHSFKKRIKIMTFRNG